MPKKPDAVKMFADKGAGSLYKTLVSKARARIGARGVIEDPKQTCVHIIGIKDGSAYAGIHPRKDALLVNIKLDSPLKGKRIRKAEQISKNRWHSETLVSSEAEIDEQLLDWLAAARDLAD